MLNINNLPAHLQGIVAGKIKAKTFDIVKKETPKVSPLNTRVLKGGDIEMPELECHEFEGVGYNELTESYSPITLGGWD